MTTKYNDMLDTKGVTVAFDFPTPQVAWTCAGYDDPDVFDPVDSDTLALAQSLCGTCAVRDVCLGLGTSRGEWGVWGGVLLEAGKPVDKVRQSGRPRKVTAA
ncbi:MAG TPA: WhiB family transcriptional regulator [Marmoricola sp.]|jgi:hypothetical protein|nr:WhiB family transcriptional regulator [Marmoricola sp.]